jgi:hypothetical protein
MTNESNFNLVVMTNESNFNSQISRFYVIILQRSHDMCIVKFEFHRQLENYKILCEIILQRSHDMCIVKFEFHRQLENYNSTSVLNIIT